MGKVAGLLVKSGIPEQHHSGIRNTRTPKILNLLKIRGEKITGCCEIISGKIIL
jgi:hypothetical protein